MCSAELGWIESKQHAISTVYLTWQGNGATLRSPNLMNFLVMMDIDLKTGWALKIAIDSIAREESPVEWVCPSSIVCIHRLIHFLDHCPVWAACAHDHQT